MYEDGDCNEIVVEERPKQAAENIIFIEESKIEESPRPVEKCECPNEKHEGQPCDCLICAEQPGEHPPVPCPLPPERRPEVIAEARDKAIAAELQKEHRAYLEEEKKKIETRMAGAVAAASKIIADELLSNKSPNSHNSTDRTIGTVTLALKIYDEFKQAEKILE